jgi:hypothetical protein
MKDQPHVHETRLLENVSGNDRTARQPDQCNNRRAPL